MWRLNGPICHMFCKQAAFKRSLSPQFTSAGLFGTADVSLHFLVYLWVGAISGCQVDIGTALSDWWDWHFHSVFMPVCYLSVKMKVGLRSQSRVLRTVFDRCISADNMAVSSKNISYRKCRYGLVYFSPCVFCKKTMVVLRDDLTQTTWGGSVITRADWIKLHVHISNTLSFLGLFILWCIWSTNTPSEFPSLKGLHNLATFWLNRTE